MVNGCENVHRFTVHSFFSEGYLELIRQILSLLELGELDLGVLLSSKIEETTIAGKKVFNVADNYLIACFDSNVAEETIKDIAQQKPYYFVMRDSSLGSDSVAINFDQIFEAYSPTTIRKVL